MVAFLLAALLLLIAGPRVEPVASVLSPIFVPIDSVVSGVTDDVSATVSSLTSLPRLQSEINGLKRQNSVLIKKVAMEPIYARENRTLSRELNFRDLNPHLDLQPARVIGQSLLGLNSSITISAGSNQGLRMGNPVFDPNGFVVGKVTQVWRASSTVGLLTAPNISIPAMDAKTGSQGLVDTTYGGSPRLSDVLTGRRINAGDLVVTSGLGNEFPVGSYIGQITHVQTSNVQAFQYAPIHTGADLNNLQYVQVALNFGPTVKVKYTRGLRPAVP